MKTKYILLNRAHNILELVDFSPNVSFITSETEHDYYQNGKYKLTNKIPELHEIIV